MGKKSPFSIATLNYQRVCDILDLGWLLKVHNFEDQPLRDVPWVYVLNQNYRFQCFGTKIIDPDFFCQDRCAWKLGTSYQFVICPHYYPNYHHFIRILLVCWLANRVSHNIHHDLWYPPVIKHGLLEISRFIDEFPNCKPPFSLGDFPATFDDPRK